MIEEIKELLINYLNENLITSNIFILYSKNKNYSELIKFKNNKFEILKHARIHLKVIFMFMTIIF